MSNAAREPSFFSIGVMPILMGLGHLAPAMGTIHNATGFYQYPRYILGMITYDTYKDTPLSNRPQKWIWSLWIFFLWSIIFICIVGVGFPAAMQIYRFSLVGMFWGTPCIPFFSQAVGFQVYKPKAVVSSAKSLIVAICMGYVTAETCSFYFCHSKNSSCDASSLRARSLYLSILYQFFRETTCDIRDIAEDMRDGMKTLPVRLGKKNTLLLMAGFGALLDILIIQGGIMTQSCIRINASLVVEGILRVGMTIGLYAKIIQYPKENRLAWGFLSLFGLTPVLWAQRSLREA
ncbi:hypothetical protein N431DRAFT_337271 [Stipitochalara longipes BDJ]|nr:hypothetical protein N431DRAFT_337271 [Stipitochalara longipes BDJ]